MAGGHLSEFAQEIQLAALAMGLNPDGLKPDPVLGPLGLSSSQRMAHSPAALASPGITLEMQFQGNTL